jgi:hypothetical protein
VISLAEGLGWAVLGVTASATAWGITRIARTMIAARRAVRRTRAPR